MSFFFDTVEIPFWFIVFIFSSAAPLWLRWYKSFYKKFIVTGLLNKTFHRARSTAEMKIDVLKKATDHWNSNDAFSDFTESKVEMKIVVKTPDDKLKKQNIKVVLKELVEGGETGVLAKSISDKMKIKIIETTNALSYLTEKKYAEVINSTKGSKYYLTDLGRRYCVNKKYI